MFHHYLFCVSMRLRMAQLVEALRYKQEGRRFDSRWCHWNFSWTYSFRPHIALGLTQPLTEISNRSKACRCVGLTTLSPCADCPETWEPQLPGILRPCPGQYRDCFTFTFHVLNGFCIVLLQLYKTCQRAVFQCIRKLEAVCTEVAYEA